MSWNDMPGLGTATGTRVDSAAKHIMACKVDTRLLSCWLQNPEGDAINVMHSEKMKWCMHKDEVVLNTSKNNTDIAVKAYPMVITTVGDMKPAVKTFLKSLYGKSNASDFHTLYDSKTSTSANDVDAVKKAAGYDLNYAVGTPQNPPDDVWNPIKQQILSLPDFRCQGIALGQAWASYLSGDTVASVLVGGMVTVQNGHFTMHTGDLVQWYFDFEQELFDYTNRNTHGCRLPPRQPNTADRNKKREAYMDERLYGSKPTLGKGSYKAPTSVVRIKSYQMHTVNATVQNAPGGAPGGGGAAAVVTREYFKQDHWGDKIRVFAKCISGGRPFDMVDIMLMTQSL